MTAVPTSFGRVEGGDEGDPVKSSQRVAGPRGVPVVRVHDVGSPIAVDGGEGGDLAAIDAMAGDEPVPFPPEPSAVAWSPPPTAHPLPAR